jgi:hypothetical protein
VRPRVFPEANKLTKLKHSTIGGCAYSHCVSRRAVLGIYLPSGIRRTSDLFIDHGFAHPLSVRKSLDLFSHSGKLLSYSCILPHEVGYLAIVMDVVMMIVRFSVRH